MIFENVIVYGKILWRIDLKSVYVYGCRDYGYFLWVWFFLIVLVIGLYFFRSLSRCCIKMFVFNFEVMGNLLVYFFFWYVKMCFIFLCGLVVIV